MCVYMYVCVCEREGRRVYMKGRERERAVYNMYLFLQIQDFPLHHENSLLFKNMNCFFFTLICKLFN